jgi:hypothetical protein
LNRPTHLVHTSPVTSPQLEQVCLLSSFSGSVVFARLLVLSLENFENDLSVLVLQDIERPIAASVRGDGVALQPSAVWKTAGMIQISEISLKSPLLYSLANE